MKRLMIVESPAKVNKIKQFLGDGWRVEACLGHVRDLPDAELGVSVDGEFQPDYRIPPAKLAVVRKLQKAIKESDELYLATDPDREGEAIGWHLLEIARPPRSKAVYRVTFNAITPEVVQQAVAHPRKLDMNLIHARETRRIVDRLVGYLVSPLACKVLQGRFSAGRVQSVALRLVVEREREIEGFKSEPFWTLGLKLSAVGGEFTARLDRAQGITLPFTSREPVNKLVNLLKSAVFWVSSIETKEKQRQPLPPFTTSTLQQAAASQLGLPPERTMELAQMLYEDGMITYHRTDGVAVVPEAQAAAREYVRSAYGADYLPPQPPLYRTKTANAQEAHEGIRPTDVHKKEIAADGEDAALYALIWQRFIASQMQPARYTLTGISVSAGKTFGQPYPMNFVARGRQLVFPGFMEVYAEPEEDSDAQEMVIVPPVTEKEILVLVEPLVTESATRAPARYAEGTLVKKLEELGVGRPSTYASMIKLIKERGYAKISQRQLVPTMEGIRLSDFLVGQFIEVFAYEYTARLEEQLDAIASGHSGATAVIKSFWSVFQPLIAQTSQLVVQHQPPQPDETVSGRS